MSVVTPEAGEPPIVAATWQEREPAEPWGPPELSAAFPWVATHSPPHAAARHVSAFHDWTLAAATRRGRSHAHAAQHREDAFALYGERGLAIFAAADGAGSAKWSRVGAEVACRQMVESLTALLALPGADPVSSLVHAVRVACERLVTLATAAGGAPRDLRTTLLVGALVESRDGDRLAVCQVGDGCVVVRRRDGRVEQIGTGDSGEFSGEVSCFVPDAEAVARAEASVTVLDASDIDCVLLCTDGVEDPFYPIARRGTTLVSQLFDGVTEPAEHFQKQETHGAVLGHPDMLVRLEAWLRFERRGENDDRTLVAAFRRRAANAAPA